jgi:type VI secretion system protein ImpF
MTIADFLTGTPTSLEYGLPDTLILSAQSATDLQRWELVILRAIALYEPRLIQVRVAVAPDRFRPTLARLTIMALAAVGRELCQFHFDTALDERNVRVGAPA